jgi:hypothetical protein
MLATFTQKVYEQFARELLVDFLCFVGHSIHISSYLSQNSGERCLIFAMHSRELLMFTGKEEHVVRQKNDVSHDSE